MSAQEGRQAVLALAGGRDPERTLEEIRQRAADRSREPRDSWATYDELGRKQPWKFGFMRILRAIPALAERVAVVPPRAVVEQGTDEKGPYSLIECPCSAKPVARVEIEKCPGCERYYACVPESDKVIVAYGDMDVPGAPASK